MNQKTRIKILHKISQNQTTTLPTEQAAQNKTLPPPPTFEASNIFPNIRQGYNTNTVQIINSLISLLNEGIYYVTAGALNFQKFKDNNFTFDASKAPSIDQKNLMNFSKKIYTTILNSGNNFSQPVTSQQITNMVDELSSSLELNSLSQTAPNSPLSKKFQGNIKLLITNLLTYLKLANPIQK